MGEKGAAASKQPPTARIPAPWGFRILVAGANATGRPASGADRGQGGEGSRQFRPGPTGPQARATPGAGARATPATQHQQETDSLPQVEMVAPGQRPVPAWVPRQLRARRQRHGREVHRVVALGLHGAARTAPAGGEVGRGGGGRGVAGVGPGSPTPDGGCARPRRFKSPAGAGNRRNELGTATRRGRNRVRGRMTGENPETEGAWPQAPEFVGDRTLEERGGVRLVFGCNKKDLGETTDRLLKEAILKHPLQPRFSQENAPSPPLSSLHKASPSFKLFIHSTNIS